MSFDQRLIMQNSVGRAVAHHAPAIQQDRAWAEFIHQPHIVRADQHGELVKLVQQLDQAAPRASELMDQHLRRVPPPPGQVSPYVSRQLEYVILRCLDKAPHKRFATAMDVVEALDEVVRA